MAYLQKHKQANDALQERLWQDFIQLCQQYNLPPINLIINPHLKSANGIIRWNYEYGTHKPSLKRPITIHLALQLLQHFPYERCLETLKHEFAHYYRIWTALDTHHSVEFKAFCAKIGGTMNETLAGERFKHASCPNSGFITAIAQHRYTCTCGRVVETRRGLSEHYKTHTKCKGCGTMYSNWKHERIA